jgi:hypothetical protein
MASASGFKAWFLSNLVAILALGVAIVSAVYANDAHKDAQDALANASPAITVAPIVGTFDASGRIFTQVPHSTTKWLASISDIDRGHDWLQLTFENNGGRPIRIDAVGLREENGNELFFRQEDVAPMSASCASNKAIGACGTDGFILKPQDSEVVFLPLYAAAQFLGGGFPNHDEELKIAYRSGDVRDDASKRPDALVDITG